MQRIITHHLPRKDERLVRFADAIADLHAVGEALKKQRVGLARLATPEELQAIDGHILANQADKSELISIRDRLKLALANITS